VLSAALIKPVHIARDALAEKLGEIWPRNRTDMSVGKMSKPKIQESLVSLPSPFSCGAFLLGWGAD
jgi:hypothetical protein